jgi:hypothetical protein
VYLRLNEVTWVAGRDITDGGSNNSMLVQQTSAGASPQLRLFAGTGGFPNNTDLAVGSYGTITAIFNGASSSLQINSGTAVTGNPGATNPGGLTLGAAFGTTVPSNVQVKEMIVYSTSQSAAQQALIIAYLSAL